MWPELSGISSWSGWDDPGIARNAKKNRPLPTFQPLSAQRVQDQRTAIRRHGDMVSRPPGGVDFESLRWWRGQQKRLCRGEFAGGCACATLPNKWPPAVQLFLQPTKPKWIEVAPLGSQKWCQWTFFLAFAVPGPCDSQGNHQLGGNAVRVTVEVSGFWRVKI